MLSYSYLRKISFLLLLFCFSFAGNGQTKAGEKFCGKKLIGYVAFWNSNPSVDYSLLSHAFFSYLCPKKDGTLVPFSVPQQTALQNFLLKTTQHGCQRFISLADGGSGTFAVMASDPISRKRFIENVIAFCMDKKMDGIDIDWESMNNDLRKKNYTSLLKEFRQATLANGLKLTATVYFGEARGQWIEDEALQQADWIQVMAYDQTGLKSDSPCENHASFDHFIQAQKYWTNRGFKPDRIVMGLPFYGYKFASENGGKGMAKKYSTVVNSFPNLNSSDNKTPGNDLTFFNGPDLIYKKTKYALDNGCAGVMIWEMSQDTRNLSKSLHKKIIQAFSDYCTK